MDGIRLKKFKKRREYQKRWIATKRKLDIMHIEKPSSNLQSENNFSDSDSNGNTTFALQDQPQSSNFAGVVNNSPLSYDMRKEVSIYSSSNAIEAYCDSELDDADKQIEIDHDSANVMDLWRHIDEQTFVVSSDSEYEENTLNADDLAAWAIKFSIKHNALDRLLKLLQQSGHSSLPATARSLLKTCPSVELTFVSGMQYFYFGIKKQLKQQFVKYPSNVQINVTTLPILLNIDGLPLFSSSGSSVWPVLCELNLLLRRFSRLSLPMEVQSRKT